MTFQVQKEEFDYPSTLQLNIKDLFYQKIGYIFYITKSLWSVSKPSGFASYTELAFK